MEIPTSELEPCEFIENFFKVPGKPYSVSRAGIVFSYQSQKLIRYAPRYGKWWNSYIPTNHGMAHRLIASTFLRIPENLPVPIVNHKNSLKFDNRVENLEWTDYKGNSTHGYEFGLRTDNIRVKVRHIYSGFERSSYSLWDCARFFEVNGAKVFGYIYRKRKEVVFEESWLLVREEESFPEPEEYSSWEIHLQDMHFVAYNLKTQLAVIADKRITAFIEVGYTHRRARKIIATCRTAGSPVAIDGDWFFSALSHLPFKPREVVDLRKPREVRYAKYKPQGI